MNSKPVSYSDIRGNHTSSWHLPYSVILNTIEWKNCRRKILERDKQVCTQCNKEASEWISGKYYRKPTKEEIEKDIAIRNIPIDVLGDGSFIIKPKKPINHSNLVAVPTGTPTILHVHHKYYIFHQLPWEYPDDAFTSLCMECHRQLHSTDAISVYSDASLTRVLSLTPCSRCMGSGFMEEYFYYLEGICFRCEGRKYDEFI